MERVTLPNSLVGRHAELGRLAMLGRQALSGQLQGATVLGPAGVGKSRLVDEAIDRLEGSFEQVEIVTFPERPLGAYRQTRRLLRGFLGAERAARLVERVVDSAINPDLWQREVADLADEITGNLVGQSRLLVLEDLHWAPVESLELVDYLVSEILQRGQHLRCMIVANTRLLAPDAAAQAVLNRWQRSRLWTRLVVPPLSDGEVAVLVRHLGVEGDHWRQLDPILRRAVGNPLHVIALVEGLSQSDEIPSDLLPRELQDAVAGWLSRLGPEHRAILGIAGLLGDRFTASEIIELHRDETVVNAALDQSLRYGLVEQRRGWLSFLHPLVRAAAVADLPLAERTDIHLRRASLLADAPLSAAERVLGQAHHLIEVGAAAPPEVALPIFSDAAEVSARLSAWPDCARFAETALELGGELATGLDAATRIALVFLAGRAHSWNGDNELAATRFRQVIDEGGGGIDERVAQSVLDLARLQIVNAGSRAAAEMVPLLRGVAAQPPQPRHRALALELLAEEATLHGRVDSGMQLADDALAAARDAGDESAAARALFARGATHLALVELAAARRDFVDSLAAAQRADDRTARNWAITRAAHAAWLSGRLDEAAQLAREGRVGTRSHRHLGSEGYAGAVGAGVALTRGDLVEAVRAATEAVSIGVRAGFDLALQVAVPVLLAAQLATGDDDELDRALESLAVLVPGRYRLAREVVSLARGAPVDIDDKGRSFPQSFVGASAAALAAAASAEAAEARPAAAEAATLLAGLDELTICPGWPVARRRLIGETLAATGDVEGALDQLESAVHELTRDRALPELARSHLQLASLALLGDRPAAQARTHAREALSLVHRCGSYRWLAQAESLVRRTLRDSVGAPTPAIGPETRVVLVTDLAGSTALSVDEGDEAYYQQIHDHYALVRRALARFGGSEFDSAGDGLYAYFADLSAAERCALSIVDETPVRALRVRIGLALGEPLVRDGRVWGSVVNLAARLVAVAEPGQIVGHDAVAAASAKPSAYRALGLKALKGFPVTIGVQELVYQGSTTGTPAF